MLVETDGYRNLWKPKSETKNSRQTAKKQGLTPKELDQLEAEIVELAEQIDALKESVKSTMDIVKEKQATHEQLKILIDNHFQNERIFYTHIHTMR